MKLSSHSRAGLFVIATLGALWVAACSDDDGPNGLNGLGGGDFGGASGATVGGATNQGGSTVGQGGTVTTGGTSNVAGSGATPTAGGTTAVTAGGASSVGGASAAGAPSAGAGGGTAACGTTKGSFQYSNTTVTPTSTLPLDGFAKSGSSSNAAAVVDVVNTPATLCADGCLRLGGSFAAGDPQFNKTVAIQKSLTGAAANLLGAKVVVKMAIENPANVPIWMSLFSQGSNTSWGAVGKANAQLTAHNNAFAEFVWDVADMKDYANKQFCADSVTNIGVMLQTGAAVTAPGTVNVYIKSIEIRPAGYVPQGTGGASSVGGSAGAAGWLTAGNAGTAGSQ